MQQRSSIEQDKPIETVKPEFFATSPSLGAPPLELKSYSEKLEFFAPLLLGTSNQSCIYESTKEKDPKGYYHWTVRIGKEEWTDKSMKSELEAKEEIAFRVLENMMRNKKINENPTTNLEYFLNQCIDYYLMRGWRTNHIPLCIMDGEKIKKIYSDLKASGELPKDVAPPAMLHAWTATFQPPLGPSQVEIKSYGNTKMSARDDCHKKSIKYLQNTVQSLVASSAVIDCRPISIASSTTEKLAESKTSVITQDRSELTSTPPLSSPATTTSGLTSSDEIPDFLIRAYLDFDGTLTGLCGQETMGGFFYPLLLVGNTKGYGDVCNDPFKPKEEMVTILKNKLAENHRYQNVLLQPNALQHIKELLACKAEIIIISNNRKEYIEAILELSGLNSAEREKIVIKDRKTPGTKEQMVANEEKRFATKADLIVICDDSKDNFNDMVKAISKNYSAKEIEAHHHAAGQFPWDQILSNIKEKSRLKKAAVSNKPPTKEDAEKLQNGEQKTTPPQPKIYSEQTQATAAKTIQSFFRKAASKKKELLEKIKTDIHGCTDTENFKAVGLLAKHAAKIKPGPRR